MSLTGFPDQAHQRGGAGQRPDLADRRAQPAGDVVPLAPTSWTETGAAEASVRLSFLFERTGGP